MNRCAMLRAEHSRFARQQTTGRAQTRLVSEHDRRRLGSRHDVPFTGSTGRGLGPAGSHRNDARRKTHGSAVSCDTAGAVARCRQGDIETSDVGTVSAKALPAREARRVSRRRYRGSRALRLTTATASTTGSTEAGAAKHPANVSHDPGSANCAGSRAPLAVTLMHAPTGTRDGRHRSGVRSSNRLHMRATGSPE